MSVSRYRFATPLPDAEAGEKPEISPCGACSVRRLAVCGAVPQEDLHELAAQVVVQNFTAKQPIFDESSIARHVYIVTAGTIKIYRLMPDGRRQVTGFLFEGDFLGFAHDNQYAYSAEAVGDVSLCRFQKEDLERLLKRFPEMEKRLLDIANHELAAAQDQMVLLGRKTAREKISSFFLMLSERAKKNGGDGNPVAVAMTRADIADYLGLTTETVSRVISSLKQEGLIENCPDHAIRLLAPDTLGEIAEGY